MYKLLLCWRYLRTRWIALASVVSVMLGVATMIVVNAVMAGFSHEMQTRIHGILSDLVFESHSLSGFQDPQWHMEEILRAGGDEIEIVIPLARHDPVLASVHFNGQADNPTFKVDVDREKASALQVSPLDADTAFAHATARGASLDKPSHTTKTSKKSAPIEDGGSAATKSDES